MKVLVAISLLASRLQLAAQPNYRSENFGNRSILLNGNVTGSVSDLGLTYYNPARLAIVESPAFTINARAYRYSTLNYNEGESNAKSSSDTNFDGLPTMLAGTFSINKSKKHLFAYSLISKERTNVEFGYNTDIIIDDIIDLIPGDETYSGRFNIGVRRRDEWFGLSYATKLGPNLSIGASAFLSVFSNNAYNNNRYVARVETNNTAAVIREVEYGFRSYSFINKLSVAYLWGDKELGATITLPAIQALGTTTLRYEDVVAGIGSDFDRFFLEDFDDLEYKRRTPLGIAIGAGIPLGKHMIHCSAEWYSGIAEYEVTEIPPITSAGGTELNLALTEQLRSVFNAGLGAEIYVNDGFNIYASFTTDFSAIKKNTSVFDLFYGAEEDRTDIGLDFIHFATGISLDTNWAEVTLGINYARSSDKFDVPSSIPPILDANSGITQSRLTLGVYTVVVGIEIPFINRFSSQFIPKNGGDEEKEDDPN